MNNSIQSQVDRIPYTTLVPVPGEDSGPVTVIDRLTALRMRVIDRPQVGSLVGEWSKTGVYILLYRHNSDGIWRAYVGKTANGLNKRLKSHYTKKPDWYRVLLVKRNTPEGFNSAEVGWLEGHLYDELDSAETAVLVNKSRSTDDTLEQYERQILRSLIKPVVGLLALLGHDTSTADEVIEKDEGDDKVDEGGIEKADTADHMTPRSGSQKRYYGVTVKDLIDCNSIKSINDGTQLESAIAKWPAVAYITAEGKIEYKGKAYDTPSAAGKAAKGGVECPGWDFWAVRVSGEPMPLKTLRARYLHKRDGKDKETGEDKQTI